MREMYIKIIFFIRKIGKKWYLKTLSFYLGVRKWEFLYIVGERNIGILNIEINLELFKEVERCVYIVVLIFWCFIWNIYICMYKEIYIRDFMLLFVVVEK